MFNSLKLRIETSCSTLILYIYNFLRTILGASPSPWYVKSKSHPKFTVQWAKARFWWDNDCIWKFINVEWYHEMYHLAPLAGAWAGLHQQRIVTLAHSAGLRLTYLVATCQLLGSELTFVVASVRNLCCLYSLLVSWKSCPCCHSTGSAGWAPNGGCLTPGYYMMSVWRRGGILRRLRLVTLDACTVLSKTGTIDTHTRMLNKKVFQWILLHALYWRTSCSKTRGRRYKPRFTWTCIVWQCAYVTTDIRIAARLSTMETERRMGQPPGCRVDKLRAGWGTGGDRTPVWASFSTWKPQSF